MPKFSEMLSPNVKIYLTHICDAIASRNICLKQEEVNALVEKRILHSNLGHMNSQESLP